MASEMRRDDPKDMPESKKPQSDDGRYDLAIKWGNDTVDLANDLEDTIKNLTGENLHSVANEVKRRVNENIENAPKNEKALITSRVKWEDWKKTGYANADKCPEEQWAEPRGKYELI
ncbi:hypothetical protein NG791_26875 [Laspinema sp. D1]|uniref:hypothetical protein n=1 Tax=Laspinema palackyanum TaxID=3231601 RepID=UPI0034821B71|nr:hypothetical protein [Laspinema sp. D2b]